MRKFKFTITPIFQFITLSAAFIATKYFGKLQENRWCRKLLLGRDIGWGL